MGYLTTITLHNDALDAFQGNPEAFAKALFDGIRRAETEQKEVEVPFGSFMNYISVQPPRHASETILYLHAGNSVTNISPLYQDFKRIIEQSPTLAVKWIRAAQRIITGAKKELKGIKP